MKNNIRINWFVDFDKEEEWLNKMSANGLCLWHTNGVIYRFKKCMPGEFIFQIDFDEKKSSTNEDYIVFRTSCGDKFVHQWKNKLYWKRITAEGPFESEDNVQAKLRMTNKAYNYHISSLIGLIWIMALGFLVCAPVGHYLLAESAWGEHICQFGLGLTGGILFAECMILIPVINRLRKKMNELIKKAI